MRYPEGHKEEVRQRIIRAAARALREGGLDAVSIPALMKGAGLTHGGFYAHFESREELVAEAVRSAASDTSQGALGEGVALEDSLARYLSMGHVEHPEEGCVLAALGTDGRRQPGRVRQAFSEAAVGLLRQLEQKLHPGRSSRQPSNEALRLASTMVGALVLARLVSDPKLSERILKAARERSEG